MKISCAIIDDEPLAVKLLESYVAKTPFLDHCGSYGSAVEALYTLQATPVDLLFLDIQMPDLNGLDFAKVLGGNTHIVFTTAFSQYAIDSYKVNAVDYLLKPISYTDFLTAANKVLDICEREQASRSAAAGVATAPADSFFVKSDYKLIRLRYDDILYVEGLKDYVKIYLESTPRPLLSLTAMRVVESFLPADTFLRVHRSFIVNMSKVPALERGQIVFGEKRLPISDSYKEAVQDYVNRHLLQGRGSTQI
jgi:DNA-binding LytR/AlgR family response regulator